MIFPENAPTFIWSPNPTSAFAIGQCWARNIIARTQIIFLAIFIIAWRFTAWKHQHECSVCPNDLPRKCSNLFWSPNPTSTVVIGSKGTRNIIVRIFIIFLAIFIIAWRFTAWKHQHECSECDNDLPRKWSNLFWRSNLSSTVAIGHKGTRNHNVRIFIIFLAIFIIAWRFAGWWIVHVTTNNW